MPRAGDTWCQPGTSTPAHCGARLRSARPHLQLLNTPAFVPHSCQVCSSTNSGATNSCPTTQAHAAHLRMLVSTRSVCTSWLSTAGGSRPRRYSLSRSFWLKASPLLYCGA